MAIIDFFDRGWRLNPDGTAYIQDERRYSFREVGELSCRIANALLAAGFGREAKGAVWAGNDVTAWACTLGLWRANMCWIPVGARNAPKENCDVLDAFDCEILFFQKYFADIVLELRPRLPKVKLWVCIDADVDDVPSLERWCGGHPATRPEVACEMDDVVALSPTGGTTGVPKGVMNTHRSLQTFFAHFLMSCGYGAEELPVNLAAAPMTHTAGLLSIPCTARGGTVVIVTRPDPMLLLSAIPKYRVTEFFLPPTVIYRLLDVPGLKEKVDFSSLKYF
ncbi:MAG: AMP-binding protein, partial [Alphaproteobacteria bacterium]|nr:AMP-binding protein [Alphaproteobacteria bacterium]